MLRTFVGLTLALVLAGCATPAAPRGGGAKPTAGFPSALPLGCVPEPSTAKCDAFGTYYTGDDLRSTGTPHVGQALIMLDPALSH